MVVTVDFINNFLRDKFNFLPMWRHSTMEISNGFATHKALYLQSVRPTSLMYRRYPYGSFAEYSEEWIRGNRRGLLINARVVGISRGNKGKNLFGFESKDSFCPELRSAKD